MLNTKNRNFLYSASAIVLTLSMVLPFASFAMEEKKTTSPEISHSSFAHFRPVQDQVLETQESMASSNLSENDILLTEWRNRGYESPVPACVNDDLEVIVSDSPEPDRSEENLDSLKSLNSLFKDAEGGKTDAALELRKCFRDGDGYDFTNPKRRLKDMQQDKSLEPEYQLMLVNILWKIQLLENTISSETRKDAKKDGVTGTTPPSSSSSQPSSSSKPEAKE